MRLNIKKFIYIAHHHAPTNPPLVTSPSHILKYSIAQYDIFRLSVSQASPHRVTVSHMFTVSGTVTGVSSAFKNNITQPSHLLVIHIKLQLQSKCTLTTRSVHIGFHLLLCSHVLCCTFYDSTFFARDTSVCAFLH